jgi:hypothetical protein
MKTAKLFLLPLRRAKSRRDGALLTVCFSLRAFSLRAILLPALLFFFCASLHAQVTIGGLENPKTGAILDLNSTAKGGLLLSNVGITDLDFIPDNDSNVFPDVDPGSLDENWDLRGAVVYNTNPATGVGVYVWTGLYWMPATESEPVEQILFTIHTTDGGYIIPTCGYVGGTYAHTYDWNISVDGGTNKPYAGTGGGAGTGITLSSLTSGDHQIRITPNGNPIPGWGNAFGHYGDFSGAIVVSDEKLISIDAPLTTRAFAPKTTESTINASYMFASLFCGCPNLTSPAVIIDSYKLPRTITDLSFFFANTYSSCTGITVPQDFAPLSSWLNKNNSIENLSNFLTLNHINNSLLIAPVNLAPLFSANNSIQNLSNFLYATHYEDVSLEDAIDLTPVSGWFSANTSISDLSGFLLGTHLHNKLTVPINLTPVSGWFHENTHITNLSRFLRSTHFTNASLTTPVDLTPVSGWFSANTSITNLSSFLDRTHNGNTSLTATVDLTPVSGWFSTNISISDLSYFLYETYLSCADLTDPVNLTPLSGWFSANRSMTNLTRFLYNTHLYNISLNLSGQVIFPDWIKTLKEGGTTAIKDVSGAFYRTFYVGVNKTDDTGEPQFQGIGALSSLGTPSSNKETYTNRTGITPSSGWQ